MRVSSVKPLVTQMAFTCTTCTTNQMFPLTDGKYHIPTKCSKYGCRGKKFIPDRSAESGTESVDWQRIRIQEKLADDQIDSGRIPRTVECELTLDLVDMVVPGDMVSICGIVKVLATDEG